MHAQTLKSGTLLMTEAERTAFLYRKADFEAGFALNIIPGQSVMLTGEVSQKAYIDILAIKCKEYGAGKIYVDLRDPAKTIERITGTSFDTLIDSDIATQKKYQEWFDERGAVIGIATNENPAYLEGLDPSRIKKYQKVQLPVRERLRNLVDENLAQWVLAPLPTAGWAKLVFPNDQVELAKDKLTRELDRCMRLDQPNPIEAWKQHIATLDRRAQNLNEMKIDKLRFVGYDTDITIGLSTKHKFIGTSVVAQNGQRFIANLPSEEVFTTPDARRTEGVVRITRPVIIDGVTVEGLILTFSNGKIIEFDASKGKETFAELLAQDEGALRLGEIALVDVSSPVNKNAINFFEAVLDENAVCHAAIGEGYLGALEGGEEMDEATLASVGYNSAKLGTHVDLGISTPNTYAYAYCHGSNSPILIMRKGVLLV